MVIPALNEEEPIGAVVRAIPPGIADEVLVVDNGSTDRTAECARAAGARVIAEPRRGYGRACRTGIQAVAADSEIIVFLDGDGSDCPEFILCLPRTDSSVAVWSPHCRTYGRWPASSPVRQARP